MTFICEKDKHPLLWEIEYKLYKESCRMEMRDPMPYWIWRIEQ